MATTAYLLGNPRKLKTLFLRVPLAEWPHVSRGLKREFRAHVREQMWNVVTPTPVIAYTKPQYGDHEWKLMVLEDKWAEQLGAISRESLDAEGCETLAEFRRVWMERHGRRFAPTRQVNVYRVRPWTPDDEQELGVALFHRLYRDFLPGGDE